jgi:hypothetical protein
MFDALQAQQVFVRSRPRPLAIEAITIQISKVGAMKPGLDPNPVSDWVSFVKHGHHTTTTGRTSNVMGGTGIIAAIAPPTTTANQEVFAAFCHG